MFYRKRASLAAAFLVVISAVQMALRALTKMNNVGRQVMEPINIAVLIQDDLISQVSERNWRDARFHPWSTAGLARDGWLHNCGFTASAPAVHN